MLYYSDQTEIVTFYKQEFVPIEVRRVFQIKFKFNWLSDPFYFQKMFHLRGDVLYVGDKLHFSFYI
ncbi:hypothetical protein BDF21DRAFT_418080 [Thamnidium elegans]|nr:hypothetical protein BDF21DRAFT_418080 [Thamnidium elegans]